MKLLSTKQGNFEAVFAKLMSRAVIAPGLTNTVAEIIASVRAMGDDAVLDYTVRFDRNDMPNGAAMRVTADEIRVAVSETPRKLRDAMALAAKRIDTFHRAQLPRHCRHALGAFGRRWLICARRQGGLSVIGADERNPGPCRRRTACRDDSAGP
jgi:histidinol dehydrogenase